MWQGLEKELLDRQQEVSSLHAISSQLLLEAEGEDSTEAKEKVHVISNKLRLLLRQVGHDLQVLQGRLVRATGRQCHRHCFLNPTMHCAIFVCVFNCKV